jgi:hypothetical protein
MGDGVPQADPANNAKVDPSWKRVWQLPELRDAVQSWTLASDAGVCINVIKRTY